MTEDGQHKYDGREVLGFLGVICVFFVLFVLLPMGFSAYTYGRQSGFEAGMNMMSRINGDFDDESYKRATPVPPPPPVYVPPMPPDGPPDQVQPDPQDLDEMFDELEGLIPDDCVKIGADCREPEETGSPEQQWWDYKTKEGELKV